MDERRAGRDAEREQKRLGEEEERLEDLEADEGKAADVQGGTFTVNTHRQDPYKN